MDPGAFVEPVVTVTGVLYANQAEFESAQLEEKDA
jgi:hypothetical protein